MKKQKLVSIIVQAYNSADTIVRTLESIKAQTYSKIELIVTDDKSKDQTIETASAWMRQNKDRFQEVKLVTTKQNTGIAGSNNRALKHAKGSYVGFVAADDYMAADAVESYYHFCEQNPDIVPISKVELFSEETCDFSSVEKYCENCYQFAKLGQKEQYRQLLIQNRIVAPAASFYPVKILQELKGFDEAYRWMEDYPINLKILKKGYRFGFLDKKLIYYRISGNSITGNNMMQLKKTEAKLFFREKMRYMILAGMGWEAVKQSKSWFKVLFKKV